jgi:hypothetical protein
MESRSVALQTVQLHAKQRRRAGVQQNAGRSEFVLLIRMLYPLNSYLRCTPPESASSQLSARSFYEVPRKWIASFLEACRWAGRVDISFLLVSSYIFLHVDQSWMRLLMNDEKRKSGDVAQFWIVAHIVGGTPVCGVVIGRLPTWSTMLSRRD